MKARIPALERLTSSQRTFIREITDRSTSYQTALLEFAERHGLVFLFDRALCVKRLANPVHQCTRCHPIENLQGGDEIGHLVHFKAATGKPVFFSLSQTTGVDAVALDATCQPWGLHWKHVGKAPMSPDMEAVLISSEPVPVTSI
ncbi:MAG TPA: hypothetical protein VMF06_05345 [Candidatus Limnocylindria bacterium]|nr:hypothetical protein [Candidatus Limnocylindria bacterium]